MRVRSENGADAAFEMMSHEILVGGRLRVHVHHNTAALAVQLLQDPIRRLKGTIYRTHESSPKQTEDGDGRSISSDRLNHFSAGRLGGKIVWLANVIVFFQDGDEFLLS